MKGKKTPCERNEELPRERLLGKGTSMCAGCGGLLALHQVYDILGNSTVFVNAAGCMSLLTVYPYTPFGGSWLYTSMASAPAGAQGVRDALDILLEKKKIDAEKNPDVVVLSGDGAAYGMGLSAASAAIDRNLDFTFLCYDNEGYGNTGQQYSPATPHGAATSTSRGASGYTGYKKDLFAIWAAHKPAYAATVIGSEPLDLSRKVEKLRSVKGPKLLLALAPCPTGWGFDPSMSVAIGRLAVETGIWPLREYQDGKVVHTVIPEKRLPVEAYLKRQERFRHLFASERGRMLIDEMQRAVDAYWAGAVAG
jgi:pyruvate ferredoxin oxidoreductase beta subunit